MTLDWQDPVIPDEEDRLAYLRYKFELGQLFRQYEVLDGSDVTTIYAFQEDDSVTPVVGDEAIRKRIIDCGSSDQQVSYDLVTITQDIIDCTDPIANLAPTDIALTNNTVSETSGIGYTIGVLSTFDPNPGDTHTYSIILDVDDKFEISGNLLRVKNLLDYDTATSHDVTIRTTDQGLLTFDKVFTIFVSVVVGFTNEKATLFQGDTVDMDMDGPDVSDILSGAGSFTIAASTKKDNPTPTPEAPPEVSGLELWLDANDETTITHVANSISQWDDRSGNSNNVTAPLAANEPTLTPNGYGARNTVSFDGTDDYMTVSLPAKSEMTVIVVFKYNQLNQASGDFDYLYSHGSGSANNMASISRYSAGSRADEYYCYDGGVVLNGPVLTGQVFQTFTQRFNSTATFHELFIDGVSQTVTDNNVAFSLTGTFDLGRYLAGNHYLDGEIAEIIVYDNAISEQDRIDVESYLTTKWVNGTDTDVDKDIINLSSDLQLTYNQADKYKIKYMDGVTPLELVATGSWGDDDYHQVIVQYDSVGQDLYLFVDGVQEDTASVILSAPPATAVRIGGNSAQDTFYDGLLDEVSIFQSVVSVPDLYNEGYAQNILDNGNLPTPELWLRMGDPADSYTTSEGILDRSGNGHHFTANNMSSSNCVSDAVFTFQDTLSLPFNGVDQRVLAPGTSTDFAKADPFSLSIWVKYDGGGSVSTIMGNMYNTNAGAVPFFTGYRLRNVATRKPSLQIIGNNGVAFSQKAVDADTGLLDDTWYHIAATYDGTDAAAGITLYVDAVAVAATISLDQVLVGDINTTHGISYGARPDDGPSTPIQFFSGKLNEASVWNKELTPTEITEIYNSGMTGDLSKHSALANMVSWTGFGDVSGDSNLVLVDRLGLIGDSTMFNYTPNPFSSDVP